MKFRVWNETIWPRNRYENARWNKTAIQRHASRTIHCHKNSPTVVSMFSWENAGTPWNERPRTRASASSTELYVLHSHAKQRYCVTLWESPCNSFCFPSLLLRLRYNYDQGRSCIELGASSDNNENEILFRRWITVNAYCICMVQLSVAPVRTARLYCCRFTCGFWCKVNR